MFKVHTALILGAAPSGESFLRLDILTPDDGAFICLKRVSKKNLQKTSPDLFDTADLQLETSKQGTTRFVREYTLITRRSSIGHSYRSLQHASAYGSLLARNAPQMAEPTALFQLAERSLDAFAESKAPEIIHLKALYLLLKDEGYPVRESWWTQLNRQQQNLARALINSPTPEKNERAQRDSCEQLIQNLQTWMTRETDLVLP